MNNYREWLVQYNGNLKNILQGAPVMVDIINEKYAILKVHDQYVPHLRSLAEIEKMEESRPVILGSSYISPKQMTSIGERKRKLIGEGVTIGWIGHKININYENYRTLDDKIRITFMYDGNRHYNIDQIDFISRLQKKCSDKYLYSNMDLCAGNDGIAPGSELIIINWQKDKFYTADAIRMLRMIIGKTHNTKMPLVVYFPVDLSDSFDENIWFIRDIINHMSLYGSVAIVSDSKNASIDNRLNLNTKNGFFYSDNAILTTGLLALVMEWGIVQGNNPMLYGEQLKCYYISKVDYLLNKINTNSRSDDLSLLDQLTNLLIPLPAQTREKGLKILDIPYDLLPEDGVIDGIVIYNSFNIPPITIIGENIVAYSLAFPYVGIRGEVRDINLALGGELGNTIGGFLSFVSGNEPVDISHTPFKPISILKNNSKYKGRGTVIGIIDTGIDYTNPAFINNIGETRIISIWDQTIGNSSPYGYGTIYEKDEINKALQSPEPFEVVPHKDQWGHGTILAGIAAGSTHNEMGEYEGVAPDAELIIVKLKTATPIMQEIYYSDVIPLAFSSLDIALGVQYIANISNTLQKPISLCVPPGTNSGSHDGTDALDSIMSTYGTNPGISIILPAGDEGNQGHHASGNLQEEKEQQIQMLIPEDQGGFVVEIWAAFGDKLEATLRPPITSENSSAVIQLNNEQVYPLGENTYVWSRGDKLDISNGCQVIRFRIESPESGRWRINIKGINIINGVYHIWIPKTGMLHPHTTFVPASPFSTIYNASTSTGIITVACYDKNAMGPCSSSGRGPTKDNRIKPDFMVEGVKIEGPLPDGQWGQITGTSPSSAITAGICSLIYEQQIAEDVQLANTIIMKALLINKLSREPTVSYPTPSRGYGLLDINRNLF